MPNHEAIISPIEVPHALPVQSELLHIPEPAGIYFADERVFINTALERLFVDGQAKSLTREVYHVALLFAQNLDTVLTPTFIAKEIWSKQTPSYLRAKVPTSLKAIRAQLGAALNDSETGAIRTVVNKVPRPQLIGYYAVTNLNEPTR